MDFSKYEGLSDELKEQLSADYESDISGLKSKNEELLGKLKGSKDELTAKEQAALEAAEKAQKAEEERLKLAGDIEGLKAHYEEQNLKRQQELEAKNEELQNYVVGQRKTEAIADVLAHVDPNFKDFARASLELSANVLYNDGKTELVFKEGDKVVATNSEEFLEYAKKSSSWQNVLTASRSTGSGGSNSTNGGKASYGDKSFNKMTAAEKVAYLDRS